MNILNDDNDDDSCYNHIMINHNSHYNTWWLTYLPHVILRDIVTNDERLYNKHNDIGCCHHGLIMYVLNLLEIWDYLRLYIHIYIYAYMGFSKIWG